MEVFKSLFFWPFVALVFCGNAFAVPAYPGLINYTQPDGSVVKIRNVGNEHFHYTVTEDSEFVARDSLGYWNYADENGKPTGVRFHKKGERSEKDRHFIEKRNSKKVLDRFLKRKREKIRSPYRTEESQDGSADTTSLQSVPFRAAPLRAAAVTPIDDVLKIAARPKFTSSMTLGELRGLLILVQFSDVKFKSSTPQEDYDRYMNQEGYSENGMRWSVRDYFISNSMGAFQPHFDVAAPVTLSKSRSYYGSLQYPDEAFVEAINIIKNRGDVDFSLYDNNGDRSVDFVYMIYAGIGEADTGVEETIWPQAAIINPVSVGNRYSVYRYACSNEISGNAYSMYGSSTKILAGIGVFVHEYSHVLGLPDFYDTDDMNNQMTPTVWDLMDLGEYNTYADNPYFAGTAPPRLTAFERYSLGWLVPRVLAKENGEITLYGIDKNDAILVPSSDKNEYFLLDYRAKYDTIAPLPNSGLLVWRIRYNYTAWNDNAVNVNNVHRMYLYRADGDPGIDEYSTIHRDRYLKGDPFPGSKKVVEFNNFVTYAGDSLGVYIYDIAETDSAVTFKVKWKGVEDMPSSSSAALESSSSSEESESSSSEQVSSCSSSEWFKISSSSAVVESSSSAPTGIVAQAVAPQVRMTLEGSALRVSLDVVGTKELRLFDVQGHLVHVERFAGNAMTVGLDRFARGNYVARLAAGGKTLAIRKVSLGN